MDHLVAVHFREVLHRLSQSGLSSHDELLPLAKYNRPRRLLLQRFPYRESKS
jgi:hypothetical protein